MGGLGWRRRRRPIACGIGFDGWIDGGDLGCLRRGHRRWGLFDRSHRGQGSDRRRGRCRGLSSERSRGRRWRRSLPEPPARRRHAGRRRWRRRRCTVPRRTRECSLLRVHPRRAGKSQRGQDQHAGQSMHSLRLPCNRGTLYGKPGSKCAFFEQSSRLVTTGTHGPARSGARYLKHRTRCAPCHTTVMKDVPPSASRRYVARCGTSQTSSDQGRGNHAQTDSCARLPISKAFTEKTSRTDKSCRRNPH